MFDQITLEIARLHIAHARTLHDSVPRSCFSPSFAVLQPYTCPYLIILCMALGAADPWGSFQVTALWVCCML